jgi:hypothetical protein
MSSKEGEEGVVKKAGELDEAVFCSTTQKKGGVGCPRSENSRRVRQEDFQHDDSSSLARMAQALGNRQLGNGQLGNNRLLAAGTWQRATWRNWHITQDKTNLADQATCWALTIS